jgi:hypothetical protein
MADIRVVRSHPYTLDDAKQRLHRLIEKFSQEKARLVSEHTWSADGATCNAGGKYFKGVFAVDERELRVEIDLVGFAARMAKPMVVRQVEEAIASDFPGR